MRQMVERKVRSRAQQLYESRGKEEGQALQDWFQAESEVIDNIGSIYRKLRNISTESAAIREIAEPNEVNV